jgi:hypothetical protein
MKWSTGGCSRQMVSLKLIGRFQIKDSTIQMKIRYLTWWYTLRSASKVPILGSKGSESKEMTCPTNESRKDSELQANRMRLGECKLRVNLRIKSFPNRQGVVANPKRVETQLQLNHKSRNWKRPEPGAKQLFYKFFWVEGTSHDRCCLTTICKFVLWSKGLVAFLWLSKLSEGNTGQVVGLGTSEIIYNLWESG